MTLHCYSRLLFLGLVGVGIGCSVERQVLSGDDFTGSQALREGRPGGHLNTLGLDTYCGGQTNGSCIGLIKFHRGSGFVPDMGTPYIITAAHVVAAFEHPAVTHISFRFHNDGRRNGEPIRQYVRILKARLRFIYHPSVLRFDKEVVASGRIPLDVVDLAVIQLPDLPSNLDRNTRGKVRGLGYAYIDSTLQSPVSGTEYFIDSIKSGGKTVFGEGSYDGAATATVRMHHATAFYLQRFDHFEDIDCQDETEGLTALEEGDSGGPVYIPYQIPPHSGDVSIAAIVSRGKCLDLQRYYVDSTYASRIKDEVFSLTEFADSLPFGSRGVAFASLFTRLDGEATGVAGPPLYQRGAPLSPSGAQSNKEWLEATIQRDPVSGQYQP